MAAAGGDTMRVKHSQSGYVSAVQSRRNGAITNEIRVQCQYPPRTLMAEVSRGVVEDSEFSLVNSIEVAGVGDSNGLGTDRALSRDTGASAPKASAEAAHPVLLAQIGECKHSSSGSGGAGIGATIQIFTGRIFLRGETILVRSGNAYFSAHSQLATLAAGAPAGGPSRATPAISGALDQQDQHLLAYVSADLAGVCLFYCPGQLQLGCRQTLMRDPILSLLGRPLQLEFLSRTTTDRVRPATGDSAATASDFAAATAIFNHPAQMPPQPAAKTETPGPPNQRTLLLLGGRCILKGDTMVLLSGLMHFCGSWHRVNSGAPVRLDGTSVLARRFNKSAKRTARTSTVVPDDLLDEERDAELEQAMASGFDRPLLLNNVWLYTQGGTIFAGQTPLLTNAFMAVNNDAQPVLLETQQRLIVQMPLDTRRSVVRLFMQRCKFTVNSSGQLRAVEGVAWMRAKKVQLGPAESEQLIIRDAVAFPLPVGPHDFVRFEGRDLLYNDGLLYLEDLTPLLIGGKIYLGQQEVPLHWLSGFDEDTAHNERFTSQVKTRAITHTQNEEVDGLAGSRSESQTISLLSDGICLLESTGSMHILRGRLRIPGGQAVLVDQGVAYFPLASQFNTRSNAPAGFPPPRFFGNPVTRPSDTRQWATAVDGRLNRAIFELANVSLRSDGTLWLHDRVPLIKNCHLLLNGCLFSSADLLQKKSGQMAGGSGQMAGGSGQMAGGSGQMAGGSGQMAGGSGQMAGGSGQMAGGFGQMGEGFGVMGEGLGQKDGGLGQKEGGLGQIGEGFGEIKGGFGEMGESMGHMGGIGQMQSPGFTGSYSIFADCKREALVFSLKARFADGLHFLFGP